MTTTGQVLSWNSTLAAPLQFEWADSASSLYAPVVVHPEGQTCTTGTTTEVDQECRCVYLCRAQKTYSIAKVRYEVTTQGQNLDWGEVAIFKGAFAMAAGADMTRVGYSNQVANFGASGVYTATININITIGDQLWVAWAAKHTAGTVPVFRAFAADQLSSGICQKLGATQPSGMAASTAFGVNNVASMLCIVGLS